jgi:hypothetical protein
MARTTEAAVRLVLDTDLTSPQIVQFIADANTWVTLELANEGMSATILEMVERYLACSLIRLRDLGLRSAKFDDISEQYQVDPELTDYLRNAAAFDTSGKVRAQFMAPRSARSIKYRAGKSYQDEAAEV